jgi:hypothetical protein
MTGAEHYRKAEDLLASADDSVEEGSYADADRMVAAAHVHAALAIAQALEDLRLVQP